MIYMIMCICIRNLDACAAMRWKDVACANLESLLRLLSSLPPGPLCLNHWSGVIRQRNHQPKMAVEEQRIDIKNHESIERNVIKYRLTSYYIPLSLSIYIYIYIIPLKKWTWSPKKGHVSRRKWIIESSPSSRFLARSWNPPLRADEITTPSEKMRSSQFQKLKERFIKNCKLVNMSLFLKNRSWILWNLKWDDEVSICLCLLAGVVDISQWTITTAGSNQGIITMVLCGGNLEEEIFTVIRDE